MKIFKSAKTKLLFGAMFALAGIGALNLAIAPSAFAVAKTTTWVGTTCKGGSQASDCYWSTATNWDLGTPVSDDSVIFTEVGRGGDSYSQPKNDIQNLSIKDITFSGNDATAGLGITFVQPITLTGDISKGDKYTCHLL